MFPNSTSPPTVLILDHQSIVQIINDNGAVPNFIYYDEDTNNHYAGLMNGSLSLLPRESSIIYTQSTEWQDFRLSDPIIEATGNQGVSLTREQHGMKIVKPVTDWSAAVKLPDIQLARGSGKSMYIAMKTDEIIGGHLVGIADHSLNVDSLSPSGSCYSGIAAAILSSPSVTDFCGNDSLGTDWAESYTANSPMTPGTTVMKFKPNLSSGLDEINLYKVQDDNWDIQVGEVLLATSISNANSANVIVPYIAVSGQQMKIRISGAKVQ